MYSAVREFYDILLPFNASCTTSKHCRSRVHLAGARPILACGGSFELQVQDPPSTRSGDGATTRIQVNIMSSDPDHTAKEIGRRLWVR